MGKLTASELVKVFKDDTIVDVCYGTNHILIDRFNTSDGMPLMLDNYKVMDIRVNGNNVTLYVVVR